MSPLHRSTRRWAAPRALLGAIALGWAVGCAPTPTTSSAPPAPPAASAPTAAPQAAAPAPAPLKEVTLRLDWQVIGYHAPFWAAADRGYFAENGLDVKLFEGQGSASSLQLVTSGQANVGFVDAAVMAQGLQRGMDVRMVACMFQQNMFGILSPADAPLTKPEDLKGKTLSGVPSGAGEVMWPVLAKRVGMDPDSMTLVATDVPGKYAALMSRRVDGSFHQVPTDALQFEANGFAVQRLLYSDYGLDRLGTGLVLSNATIKESPEMVRGLVAAVARGWQYALDQPAEASALSGKFFTSTMDASTLEKQWRATQPFQRTDRTRERPLFWMDAQDWESTQNVLTEAGYLPEKRPVDTYYTNEYISPT
jgi:NitT/TauT family transport system substrate-binding protein